jgi:hypothetical protein
LRVRFWGCAIIATRALIAVFAQELIDFEIWKFKELIVNKTKCIKSGVYRIRKWRKINLFLKYAYALKLSLAKTVELNAFPEAIPMQNQDGRNNRLSKISK